MSRGAGRLLRGAGLVTLGNAVSAGLGLGLLILLGRTLDPAALAIVMGVIVVIDGGQMFLDATVNTGMISLASRHGRPGAPDPALLRAGFWSKLALGLALAAVVALVARPLSVAMTDGPGMAPLLRVAAIATVAAGLQGFAIAMATAHEAFGRVALLSLIKNAVRLGAVLAVLGTADPERIGLAVCVAALAGAGLSVALVSWGFLGDRAPLRPAIRRLIGVNGWLAVSSLALLAARLDVWLVGWLASPHEAGLYAVAAQLCVGVGVVTQALVTTLLPSVSRLDRGEGMRAFLTRSARVGAPLLLLPVALVPVTAPGLTWLLGPDYGAAAGTFLVLLEASLMTLVTAPLMMTLLAVGAARTLAWGTWLQLGLRVGLAVGAVPLAGAVGMAGADVAARVLALAAMAAVMLRAMPRREAALSAGPA